MTVSIFLPKLKNEKTSTLDASIRQPMVEELDEICVNGQACLACIVSYPCYP